MLALLAVLRELSGCPSGATNVEDAFGNGVASAQAAHPMQTSQAHRIKERVGFVTLYLNKSLPARLRATI